MARSTQSIEEVKAEIQVGEESRKRFTSAEIISTPQP